LFCRCKTIEPMFSCWQWSNGVHGRLLRVWMHVFLSGYEKCSHFASTWVVLQFCWWIKSWQLGQCLEYHMVFAFSLCHNKIIIGGWSTFELPNKLPCNWLRSSDLWLKINTPNIDVLYVLRFGVPCSFYKLFLRMEYLQCSEALQIEKSSINMVIQYVFM
jgi:hypothetical protein